jgi:hypothetical protein
LRNLFNGVENGEKAPKLIDLDGSASKPPLFYQTGRANARSLFQFATILFRFVLRKSNDEALKSGEGEKSKSATCGGDGIAI